MINQHPETGVLLTKCRNKHQTSIKIISHSLRTSEVLFLVQLVMNSPSINMNIVNKVLTHINTIYLFHNPYPTIISLVKNYF